MSILRVYMELIHSIPVKMSEMCEPGGTETNPATCRKVGTVNLIKFYEDNVGPFILLGIVIVSVSAATVLLALVNNGVIL